MRISLISVFLLIFVMVGSPAHADVIFSEDFSSSGIEPASNGYLGGFYNSQYIFGQWYGHPLEVNIGGGVLNVEPTATFRSGAILLDPSLFNGQAGEYTLVFDVPTFDPGNGGNGQVRIWAGSGYNLALNSADAVFVNTESGTFTAVGNATVVEIANRVVNAAGEKQTLGFTYDGYSAIGLFFGGNVGAWPFPSISYDNIVIVPELSSLVLALLCLGVVLLQAKNRKG